MSISYSEPKCEGRHGSGDQPGSPRPFEQPRLPSPEVSQRAQAIEFVTSVMEIVICFCCVTGSLKSFSCCPDACFYITPSSQR